MDWLDIQSWIQQKQPVEFDGFGTYGCMLYSLGYTEDYWIQQNQAKPVEGFWKIWGSNGSAAAISRRGWGGGNRGKSTQPTIIVKRFEHGPIKNIGGGGGDTCPPVSPRLPRYRRPCKG